MSKKAKIDVAAAEAKEIAQSSMDQAQLAIDTAADFAQDNFQAFDAAATAIKNSFIDFQMKAVEMAQANMTAGFSFARDLFAAKDAGEVLRINQEFAKNRYEVFKTQAQELNDLTVALVKETMKPIQEGTAKTLSAITQRAA